MTNKKVDLVLTLKDFYIIHAALRLFASNLDMIKHQILELSPELTDMEIELEQLAQKIDYNINKVQDKVVLQ